MYCRTFARLTLLLLLTVNFSSQATVRLGANRIIYHAADREANLTISNTEDRDYLVQSWADAEGNPLLSGKKLPVVVTPPLFRMGKQSENVVQIVYTGDGLSQDKESLFWLNIKAIPAIDEAEKKLSAKVVLAVSNHVKVFYRPEGLPGKPADAIADLRWESLPGGKVKAINSSPYYVVLNKVMLNGQSMEVSIADNNTVIAPGSDKLFAIKGMHKAVTQVAWSGINDFSVQSDTYSENIKGL